MAENHSISSPNSTSITIKNATENNLRGLSLSIPHHQLVVVTGVSGSGKSSLAFDVIAREGQRRFYETFSSFSRQFMSKLAPPQVESIEELAPVITLGQKTIGGNARSTVGTLSDIYDHLRLLFARLGETSEEHKLSRSLFSFNSPKGACPQCTGLGLEEKISLRKLVTYPEKTLREGALAPTLPTGYIMYSQVTVDVLNQVCEAHGFSVDIPWNDLTADQQDVILNGSQRLKVPFGKHSLESRMKWTGIAAKPREEGFYKGMLPIMSDILRRDRNKNILRYVESVVCTACEGSRLNSIARQVKLKGKSIVELCQMEIADLSVWLQAQHWASHQGAIALPVIEKMTTQIEMLANLGIGYLSLDRASNGLSGGEAQRIRLVNQVAAELSQVLYVFDEPSIGLHPRDNQQMLKILRKLVENGNSVIVVEHDEATIRSADWIVDIGPGAGTGGGNLLFNGPAADFYGKKELAEISPTWRNLFAAKQKITTVKNGISSEKLEFNHCQKHNLKDIKVSFQVGGFNVVTGVAGAGKSSLVHGDVEAQVRSFLSGEKTSDNVIGLAQLDKLITIDQKPIGRTPRSNPATYTGLADGIRDQFAKTDAAKAAGFSKSRFSFNIKGGRCEACQGAGRTQLGMHLMGKVDITCEVCQGKRFNPETLAIRLEGKNIFEVFEMRVDEAHPFFAGNPKILRHLEALQAVGLGYLQLGQPSTTLSGGEAQRVKLASELHQPNTGRTLYLLDEPTIGLHLEDVKVLVRALRGLTAKGSTVICIEHNPELIQQADWVVDLGPESGKNGGQLMYQGHPEGLATAKGSLTGKFLWQNKPNIEPATNIFTPERTKKITLTGVTTHLLKGIEIEIPRNQMTVITGVSGSGKSSLAFDTLVAEAQSRFSESLSTYTRTLLRLSNSAQLESSSGLGPVVAIGRKFLNTSQRSTVGTLTGLDEHMRLLFSRIAQTQGLPYSAQNFSFNHLSGACPTCNGLGFRLTCDPEKLFAHPEKSLLEGAFVKNRTGKYFGDPHGKFIAILIELAKQEGFNLNLPWKDLDLKTRKVIMLGTGEKPYQVTWNFKNKTRSGTQHIEEPWLGFSHYIDDEYQRKLHNKNIAHLEALLHEVNCETCNGQRLKPEMLDIKWQGRNIAEVRAMPMAESKVLFLEKDKQAVDEVERAIFLALCPKIVTLLDVMADLGLSYLSPDRRARTLSGGEGQRIRLARTFSARLYGVTYVLDEPSLGLHPKDVKPLLATLQKLVAAGNTLVVVEHDEAVIRNADHIIELGPGAGREGGEVIATGTFEEILQNPASVTRRYLGSKTQADVKSARSGKALSQQTNFGIVGAYKNNLKHIDVDFHGGLMALTGVSGSGKSTLMQEVLLPSALEGGPISCSSVYGLDQFAKVFWVTQKPIAQHAQSTVATWIGLMDSLRTLFAATPEAKSSSLKKSAFSYLHKEGMCPDCKGMGVQKTALDFLGDVQTLCDTCKGERYRPEVLLVRWKGVSMGEVLQLTVAEALLKFSDSKKPLDFLQALDVVGLGHLQLGQSCATLSGGEAQRLKLARELVSSTDANHRNLYLLDEPTAGLHFHDVERLVALFERLVAAGHAVLVITHHPMLIHVADQVIELGPEGGARGGNLM